MNAFTIVFSDIEFREVGRVTSDGEKLEGDTAFAKRLVADAEYKHQSPEDFKNKFSQWSNGHYWSEITKS